MTCSLCGGHGKVIPCYSCRRKTVHECFDCYGRKEVLCKTCRASNVKGSVEEDGSLIPCPSCGGAVVVPCFSCRGLGHFTDCGDCGGSRLQPASLRQTNNKTEPFDCPACRMVGARHGRSSR